MSDPSGEARLEEMRVLQGKRVSEGRVVGTGLVLKSHKVEALRFPIAKSSVGAEIARFRQAIEIASRELARNHQRVAADMGAELAGIFEAHQLMLRDSMFLGRIESRIRETLVNAEWVVEETAEELTARFSGLEQESFRERRQDLIDVARYVLRALQGIDHHELSEIEDDVVVIADELTPSDALRLGRQGVSGLALEAGGLHSHTAIVARAFKIPLVVGLGPISSLVTDQDPVILDGNAGTLTLHPTPEARAQFDVDQLEADRSEDRRLASRAVVATTADGTRISMLANIEFPEELDDVVRYGAEGIGLYRSEFLYIEKSPQLPTEEEHFELFCRLLQTVAPRPVTIRTLDLGGRKLAREVLETEEDNPSLGLRGIRLTLARPIIFRTQLRALLRASIHGSLGVMIPLVSSLDEVVLFKALVADIQRELDREGIAHDPEVRLGAMIEVPAAALIADRLAAELDFLSIGTNDLIQYTLAVDRNNEHVAGLYQEFHPAILELICRVVGAADDAGIEVSLCGEMAANPICTPLLLGAGLRKLSVAPRAVPLIKERLSTLQLTDCRQALRRAEEIGRSQQVEDWLVGGGVE